MSEMVKRVATAMASKRMELIAQPLSRIWDDLAAAAIKEMRVPTDAMVIAGDAAIEEDSDDHTGASFFRYSAGDSVASWTAMVDAALEDGAAA